MWYGGDMNQQVTVRLPEELVAFMDRQVHEGRAASRAAVVAAAIERERRREIGERDAAILAAARLAARPSCTWRSMKATSSSGNRTVTC